MIYNTKPNNSQRIILAASDSFSERGLPNLVQFILGKVKGAKRTTNGYTFRCPAHDDKRSSAAIYTKSDGVALKCYAGCTTEQVCDALGISKSDLRVKKPSYYSSSQTVANYRYFDEAGKLLYEHRKLLAADGKKTFLYCRKDANGHTLWTLYGGWFELKGRNWKRIEGVSDPDKQPNPSARWFDEAKRVLYRRGNLQKATPGSLVLYCEGEKDVESAEALGFVATTAGSSSDWRTEFADCLAGFDLVIIPDQDDAGRRCAAKVARDCYGKAARVRVLELPGLEQGGDLSDWIKTGGTREKLLLLSAGAKDFEPETGFTIGSQPLPPIVNSEIDLSETPEIEDDDPPISADPKREIYLRQLARNTAKVIMACSIILRHLGFQKDHTRLLNALIAIGGDRLNYFRTYQASIRKQYAASGEASSIETVRRDLKRLREEQAALGVAIIGYAPGSKDFATGKGFPSRFQNYLLRYALEAINISIDTRDDFNTARKALEAACLRVVETIPRIEPIVPKEKQKKQLVVEDLEAKYLEAEKRLFDAMITEGWTLEEIEMEFERLECYRNRRLNMTATGENE
ncbi:MAG: hypothetical protein HY231_21865 [Acidobacteria bacterium]|nr:hypothetical protein [Acidobacteriota bacterium]